MPNNFAMNFVCGSVAATVDGCRTMRECAERVEFAIRSSKYLNNIVEQDHRRIKFRTAAMLGFKSFQNAKKVLAGIELIHKLKKGQYGVPVRFGMFSHDIWCHVLAA